MTAPNVAAIETLLRDHAHLDRAGVMDSAKCFAGDWEGSDPIGPEPADYVPHAQHVAQLIVSLYETPAAMDAEVVMVPSFQRWAAERSNPACLSGEHEKCHGEAWDTELRDWVPCMCGCIIHTKAKQKDQNDG